MRWLAIAGLASSLGALQPPPPSTSEAEQAHARAVSLLPAGDPAGAEAQARLALEASRLFSPEKEIAVAPEKNLLLEELLSRASKSYRARRARYFETLGRALAEQRRWVESRKALGRASALAPSAEIHQAMARHPDLAPRERIRLLLAALLAPHADGPSIAKALLETGGFRGRDDLQAVIDRARFTRDPKPLPVPVELQVSEPPRFRVTTDFGTLVTADALAAGATLVFYFPAPGCGRCSEELEGIGRAVSGATQKDRPVEVVVLVDESELLAARRVVRLLAMPIQVGRADRIAARERPEGPAVRVVGRGGYLSAWVSLETEPRSADLRHGLEGLFERLAREDVPPEATGAARALRGTEEPGRERSTLLALVDAAEKLEAGPLSLAEVSDRLDRLTGLVLQKPHSNEELFELLSRFTPLAGAGRAKARVLNAMDPDYPRKILEGAKGVNPDVAKEAAREDGAYRVAVTRFEGRRAVLLQRSFVVGESLGHFNIVLREEAQGLKVAFAGKETETPLGATGVDSGAVFYYERGEGVRGLRLVASGKVVYAGAPARILGGVVVEEAPALVDSLPADLVPTYVRRGEIRDGKLVAEPTPLERGLRAFSGKNYREAASLFDEAALSIDAESGYDEIDLRYNRARAYEELGERRKALDLLQSIGDAPYQDLVDQKILALGTAPRRE